MNCMIFSDIQITDLLNMNASSFAALRLSPAVSMLLNLVREHLSNEAYKELDFEEVEFI